jgi:hypothetical protein
MKMKAGGVFEAESSGKQQVAKTAKLRECAKGGRWVGLIVHQRPLYSLEARRTGPIHHISLLVGGVDRGLTGPQARVRAAQRTTVAVQTRYAHTGARSCWDVCSSQMPSLPVTCNLWAS